MRWEHDIPEFEDLPFSEIPADLLQGLERLAAEAVLQKARLRWRPYGSMASGYLTIGRLLDIGSATIAEVAGALASYAHHLHDSHDCEPRFEAQFRRELAHPEDPTQKLEEWRSLTFYIHPQPADGASNVDPDFDDDAPHDDDDDDDHDDGDGPVDDDDEPELPTYRPPPRQHERRRSRGAPRTPGPPRARREHTTFEQYVRHASLMRTDPAAFAMAVVQQSHERTVDTLERILDTAFSRLDRTLENQQSESDLIHGALETITRGSGELASVGLDLFRAGLDHQAGATRLTNETEIDKERNGLMRDAVQQGSLIAQAVLMSNAAKRRSAETQSTTPDASAPRPAPSPEPPPRPQASPEPPPTATRPGPEATSVPPSDAEVVMRTQVLLDALPPELVERVRPGAPKVAAVFDLLRSRPLTGAWVRQVFAEASASIGATDLLAIGSVVDFALLQQVAGLIEFLGKASKT